MAALESLDMGHGELRRYGLWEPSKREYYAKWGIVNKFLWR